MIDYRYNDGGRSAAGFNGFTGDCMVRAIAIITELPYETVYGHMASRMKENGYAKSGNAYTTRKRKAKKTPGQLNARDVQRLVLKELGFEKIKLDPGTKPTFTKAHKECGDCIVSTTKHVSALKDGALQDIYDIRTYHYHEYTGERKAQSIWILRP